MGLMRKAFVIGTLGTTPVGFNSKKEKIVRNTAQTARLLAEQNRMIREQMEMTPGTAEYEAKQLREQRIAEREAFVAARRKAREENRTQQLIERQARAVERNQVSSAWAAVGKWLLAAVILFILIGLLGQISPVIGVLLLFAGIIAAPIAAWRQLKSR